MDVQVPSPSSSHDEEQDLLDLDEERQISITKQEDQDFILHKIQHYRNLVRIRSVGSKKSKRLMRMKMRESCKMFSVAMKNRVGKLNVTYFYKSRIKYFESLIHYMQLYIWCHQHITNE